MTGTTLSPPPRREASEFASRSARDWSARLSEGMEFAGWWRLLRRNHFAVERGYWHSAIWITLFSFLNSFLRGWQFAERGLFLHHVRIKQPPIFIIGHWRSGTTLLHELMVLDPRHTSPNSYHCFAPNHFIITGWFAYRFLKFLLPPKRPMDNMAMGWQLPQEDEFALANLGVPSPYLSITFPNEPPQYPEYLTLEGVPPRELERWKRALGRFLRNVTYLDPKRIVLKSPPHTARVRVLREMFPDARFIHITRDPLTVFPSTVHLWRQLYRKHGLQSPRFVGLEEQVLETFERMYRRFEVDRQDVPRNRLCDVRYEELVASPEAELARVYAELELDGFELLQPHLVEYWSRQADYRTNRYEIDDATRQQIIRRWGPWMRKYGYASGE